MISAKDPLIRLGHIIEQLDGIAISIADLRFEDVKGNFLYERAIERSVQIISEAAKELPDQIRQKYIDVKWKPIISIGNLLRHEYYRISATEMWEIATIHLPELRPTIERMIADLSSPEQP
jgi:uncharacterized protein with HEPN domain